MRTSKYILYTLKETSSNSRITSYQLMLRAGIIRQLSSGLYTWLPTGLRVLHNLENIIRKAMDNIGFFEISMPIIQPAHLWQESGRLVQYGQELLRFLDRNKKLFVLGPTHEEVITHLIRDEIHSYKELPLGLYQINTKFRDELRPRFGLIRSREFIMKDAYSFHIDQASLQETYNCIHDTYINIFNNIGLKLHAVTADSGSIGGHISHEFHVLTNVGEDNIVFSTKSNYSSNIDCANSLTTSIVRCKAKEKIRLIDTPNVNIIEDLVKQFTIPLNKIIKIFIVKAVPGSEHEMIALILRGDHQLNKNKAERLPQILIPLSFVKEEDIFIFFNIKRELLGPINLPIPIIIDRSVSEMSDFVAGANIKGKHFFGINWDRDIPLPTVADLRMVVHGDFSPDGQGILQVKRSIEVAHIFQLGSKYSKLMKASIQDKNGHKKILQMGCYGIGVTRSIAAIIEQNYDDQGIIWPDILAPFKIAILPVNMHMSHYIQNITERIYQQLQSCNFDVLLDDRDERFGTMLTDIELIGIPHILIISERNLNNQTLEYRSRNNNISQIIKLDQIVDFLNQKINLKL